MSYWIKALTQYNKGESFRIPKKGTPQYEEVLKIANELKGKNNSAIPTVIPLNAGVSKEKQTDIKFDNKKPKIIEPEIKEQHEGARHENEAREEIKRLVQYYKEKGFSKDETKKKIKELILKHFNKSAPR